MKLFVFFALFLVHADEMYWYDYDTGYEYSWSQLQRDQDYVLDTNSDIIVYNIGKTIGKTCNGHTGSAILFSKAHDSCEILGNHQVSRFSPYNTRKSSGIIIVYEDGSLCKNKFYSDFKRRIEFKLICSDIESEFINANSLTECTTILEKFTPSGCATEFHYSFTAKVLFIL